MRDPSWVFKAKKPCEPKTKPISKAPLRIVAEKRVQITQNFKKRKIPLTQQDSLQNIRRKLSEIYYTCVRMKLSHHIFLLAADNLRNLASAGGAVALTAPEALACVTLAIKYTEETQNPIEKIVKATKVSRGEMLGAQYYVFEALQYRQPINDSYWADLTAVCQNWNQSIRCQLPDKKFYLQMDRQAKETTQSYRNFINLCLVCDKLLTLLVNKPPGYKQVVCLSLYFVIFHSAEIVDPRLAIKKLVKKFISEKYSDLDLTKWDKDLAMLINSCDCLQRVKTMTIKEYSEYRQCGDLRGAIL